MHRCLFIIETHDRPKTLQRQTVLIKLLFSLFKYKLTFFGGLLSEHSKSNDMLFLFISQVINERKRVDNRNDHLT